MNRLLISRQRMLIPVVSIGILSILYYGCTSSGAGQNGLPRMAPAALPVITVTSGPATTYREFPATLKGKVLVDIRPQVQGYLEKLYVDEGDFVKAGQPLFKISDNIYREQLNQQQSNLLAAEANMLKAKLQFERLKPLLDNNVVSEVQAKTAEADYEAGKAAVEQNKALIANAEINLGYTLIKAPVSGYIGKIPYRVGSLVANAQADALTVLSDVNEVYAYFSMSEQDFLSFTRDYPGGSIEDKIRALPPVELVLPDNSIYTQKGRVQTVEGQLDETMGAINFRAVFSNPQGILRSGNTGRIRLSRAYSKVMTLPQEATFDVQDKVFVFTVGDSNKVVSKPIGVLGKTANYYFVGAGLAAGDRIVYSGTANLRDGMTILPQPISIDSLLKARPL